MEFDYFWALFQIRKQFPLDLTNLHRIELLSTSEPYVGLEFYNMSVNMCPNKNIQYHVFPHVKPENLFIFQNENFHSVWAGPEEAEAFLLPSSLSQSLFC